MNYTFVVIAFLSSLIALVAGVLVIAQRPGERANRWFLAFSLAGFFYGLFTGLKMLSDNPEAFYFVKTANLFWILFLLALLFFCASIVRGKIKLWLTLLNALLTAAGAVLIAALWTTDWIYLEPAQTLWGHIAPNGKYFYLFALFSICCIIGQLIFLLEARRGTKDEKNRKQSTILILGLLVGLAAGTLFDVVLPSFGALIPTSVPMSIIIYIASFAYAMARYGLLTITPSELAKNLFVLIPDMIVFLDTEDKISLLNRRLEQSLGYGQGELLGEGLNRLLGKQAQLAGEKGRQASLQKKDGGRISVKMDWGVAEDNYGEKLGTIVVFNDISREEKYIEQQRSLIDELTRTKERMLSILDDTTQARNDARKKSLEIEKLYQELKVVDRMKTEFMSVISHELRSPLTPIRGYLEMLQEGHLGDLSPVQKNAISLLLKESIHLQGLIESILDMTRLEKGVTLTIQKEPLSLQLILSDLVEVMRPDFDNREVRLLLDIPTDFPVIVADSHKLRRLLTNILGNALKFTSRGGEAKMTARLDGSIAEIEIADNGIGIAPDNLEKIFEKFYQVDSSITRSSGGAGLGLTIAREIAKSHGGSIWAESDGLGKGAKIIVRLPIS